MDSPGELPRPARDDPIVEASDGAEPPEHLAYQPALDGLRALAVLAVIAYHFDYDWARGGFLGVDAFFVLSGFLITTLLVLEYRRARTIGLVAFWGRRARRLLPALLLVLVFVAWYTHRYVAPWERTGIRADGISALFYVTNWRFIIDQQSYFTLFSAASPLRHTWSLAIEEQFYIVWPLVVLGALRFARGSTRVLAAVCAIGATGSIVLMAALYRDGDPSRAYYGTDTHAHTLLIGALLALALLAWKPSGAVRAAIVGIGPVALVAMFLVWSRLSDTDPAYYRGGSAVFAVGVAVIISAAMIGGPVRNLLAFGPLPWIGRLSYGLYLWHWPIIVWIVPTRVHVGPTALNLIRLGLTFLVATASYYLVEHPIRAGWRRRPKPIAWLAPIGVAVTITALVASGAGATPPPSFIWGLGDPLYCGKPRPVDAKEARAANRAFGKLKLPKRVRQQRILLVGDSTACSLWIGLSQVGPASGIKVAQGSVFGCGVASGEITTTRGEQITPNSHRCPQMVDATLRTTLARSRPDLVLWMSIWEKSDIIENGKTLVSGTPAGDRAMLARMDDALSQLTRGGAHVGLITVAAPAPNDAQGAGQAANAIDDASYRRLRSINQKFAKRHPDSVTIIDLASRLCPDGPPCPERVRGERARPDGRHFDPAAATRYSRWLLRQIAKLNL